MQIEHKNVYPEFEEFLKTRLPANYRIRYVHVPPLYWGYQYHALERRKPTVGRKWPWKFFLRHEVYEEIGSIPGRNCLGITLSWWDRVKKMLIPIIEEYEALTDDKIKVTIDHKEAHGV